MLINEQLVTLFTIIFVTTISTVVKRFALYKAQIGASVASLEQYQASVSLPSSLKMIVLLRAWNWTSLLLIFVWSWYYLGSQAAQREYSYRVSSSAKNTVLISPSAQVPSDFENAAKVTPMRLAEINAEFITAYGYLSGGFGYDIYNAAIPPFYNQTVSAKLSSPDDDGWRAFEKDWTAGPMYTSRLGTPILVSTTQEASSHFIGSYTLSTSYIFTTCDQPIVGNHSAFPREVLPTISTVINGTNTLRDGSPEIHIWARDTNSSIHSSCKLDRQFVQIQASCNEMFCAPQKIRADPNSAFSKPETIFANQNFTRPFFSAMILSSGVPNSTDMTTIVDQNFGLLSTEGQWGGINGEDEESGWALSLSQGVSTLINGYLFASQPAEFRAGQFALDFPTMQGLVN